MQYILVDIQIQGNPAYGFLFLFRQYHRFGLKLPGVISSFFAIIMFLVFFIPRLFFCLPDGLRSKTGTGPTDLPGFTMKRNSIPHSSWIASLSGLAIAMTAAMKPARRYADYTDFGAKSGLQSAKSADREPRMNTDFSFAIPAHPCYL
jgi:hypothetical protein